MSTPPRYALWLRLPPAWHARLAAIIDELARRYGAPRFEPHVTLRGRIVGEPAELGRRAAALARELAPLELRFIRLADSPEFHRCLMVLVEETPALRAARAAASRCFGLEPGGFTPHASLLYAELPARERARLVADLDDAFETTARVTEIALWSVAGAPEEWREIARFLLGR